MSGLEFQEILKSNLHKVGLTLQPVVLEKLQSFCEILLAWNKKMHLVSKRDASPDRVARQIIDSLLILHYFQIARSARIIDIGSGAGFPAIPLKLARPDLEIVLSESTQKKAVYLQNVINELKLEQVKIFADRAGNLPKKYFCHFDYATAKASGEMAKNWMEVYRYLKSKSRFVTYKAKGLNQELAEVKKVLKKYPGEVEELKTIDLKELDLGGYLVSLRKL